MESDSDDAGELTGMLPLPAGGGGARPSHARIPSVPPVFSFEKRAAPRDNLGLGTSDTVGGGWQTQLVHQAELRAAQHAILPNA